MAILEENGYEANAPRVTHLVPLALNWTVSWCWKFSYSVQTILSIIVLAFEVPLLLESLAEAENGTLFLPEVTCQTVRALLLFTVAASGLVNTVLALVSPSAAEETQPLLAESSNRDHANSGYGAVPENNNLDSDAHSNSQDNTDSDSDSDDDDAASIKRQRAKRLKETGGWWGYLRDFSLFVPFLIPKNDRRVQLCILASLLVIAADRALKIIVPLQLGVLTDKLLAHESPYSALAFWLLGSLVDDGLLQLLETLAKIPIKQFSYRQITTAAFRHVMTLPIEFHSERDSAEVMKAIEQGESLADLLEVVVIDILPTFVDLIIAFGFLSWKFNTYVSLAMIIASVAYISLEIITSSWNVEARRQSSKAKREEARVMHQAVQGWQTVTYFNMLGFENRRFGQAVEKQLSADRKWSTRDAYTQAILESMVPLTFSALAGLVLYEVAQGRSSPGGFVFLLQYWDYIIYPVKFLSNNYRYFMSDLVDAERLLNLLQTKPTIFDKEGAKDLENVTGHIAFQDVQFSYHPRQQTIHDLSFGVRPGETVALVGETGAGKSSIMKLLLRLYDIDGGRITIDGHDIRDITLGSLRDALGVVPQDPLLFNTTILENLRYAKPSATDEEIYDACRAAAIHEKITTFVDGYQSQVGEQGLKLSGGEIQRLAIARVFLKDPPILLLDEATSAVDTHTEASIQSALDKLKNGRSTLVIAHRLSTVASADQILVIHNGRIVERGTHDELLSKRGRYEKLWMKQITSRASGSEDKQQELL
ncbi:hypothetical protein ACHAPT_011819 [Fusarium lateritium]